MPTHSSGDGGYPSKMGFGHEEWNFQLEDGMSGYVFGYLYYNPSKKVLRDSLGHFRIGFWSTHPDTKQKLLVGIYNDATLTTDEDFEALDRAFERRGVYKRRAEELASVVPSLTFERAMEEARGAVTGRLLKFKCPIDQVQVLADPIPLHHIVGHTSVGERFTRPTFVADIRVRRPRRDVAARRAAGAKLAEDAYYRESPDNLRRILKRHNMLSKHFTEWLKGSGFKRINSERNSADVTFRRKSLLYRAELKTCYGVGSTRAIREALGQLLEYNLYPGRSRADAWAVIIDEKPTMHDVEYLLILRHRLKLPICLGWREGSEFVFPEDLSL